MTKTKEDLQQLKDGYEALTNKLKELSDEELRLVAGGTDEDYEHVSKWLYTYLSKFRRYLKDFMLTAVYPKRIQKAIDQLDEIETELKFECNSTLDFILFRDNWTICNNYLKLSEAPEIFANEWYVKLKNILAKYNVK